MRARGEDECLTRLGKVRVLQAGRRAVELLVDLGGLPEPYRRVRYDADLAALAADLASDDAEARARAEAVARLAEPTVYLRIY
jgi:hypothetical protein